MNISAEQVFLRWRPALRQTGGLKSQPCTAQVRQYLLDHQRIFDASDDGRIEDSPRIRVGHSQAVPCPAAPDEQVSGWRLYPR